MAEMRIDPADFVRRLASARIGDTFNQYTGSPLRRGRLVAYLDSRRTARVLLVGEAAGYRGARISGIPFTSERQLSGAGPSEATATVVQRVLVELGLEGRVLLWNVVPTHPHLPGDPRSNRRPTQVEVEAALPFLDALGPRGVVVAIGRLAATVLDAPYVRHPSHAGAQPFRSGLVELLAGGQ
jgi:uracil-DNA glycosylase